MNISIIKILKKTTIKFSDDGICDACKVASSKKEEIDWNSREKELIALCDKHREMDSSMTV